MSDPRIGSVIQDRYRITDELSAGGMGVVYRGERVALGRVVAIKFLHEAFSKHDDFRQRFEREARLMSRLEHPNIVSVIDFGVAGSPYIVMDFVSGETLADLVEDGPLEPARAIAIVRQILAALEHAHGRGVIHRDIKAANVMLTSTEGAVDHVHLLDFGLGKLLDRETSLTMAAVGTPSYMSPEQAVGKSADARSDIYAIGVLLFELLSGEKPFVADEPLAVLQKHIHEPVPPLPGIDPALEAVVHRSLAKDPEARFQGPAELREALDEAAEGRAPTPAPAAPEPRRAASDVALAPTLAPAPVVPEPRGRGGFGWLLLFAALVAGAGWWVFARPSAAVLADTRAHIDDNRADAEIRALHELLRRHPERGDAARRLGDLYMTKGWVAEGLEAYAKAVAATPSLRRDPALISRIIGALDHRATEKRARAILVNHIGRPALKPARAAQRKRPRPALAETIAELERR